MSSRHSLTTTPTGIFPRWRPARRRSTWASRAGRSIGVSALVVTRPMSPTIATRCMIRSWTASSIASISRRNASSAGGAVVMG